MKNSYTWLRTEERWSSCRLAGADFPDSLESPQAFVARRTVRCWASCTYCRWIDTCSSASTFFFSNSLDILLFSTAVLLIRKLRTQIIWRDFWYPLFIFLIINSIAVFQPSHSLHYLLRHQRPAQLRLCAKRSCRRNPLPPSAHEVPFLKGLALLRMSQPCLPLLM